MPFQCPPKALTLLLDANRQEHVHEVVRLLHQGELVALPTETVYGLAGNGLCKDTVARIFQAKNRPAQNPVILHVAQIEQAYDLFAWPKRPHSERVYRRFAALAQKFWPGPLTLISQKSDAVPDEVTAGLSKVAVRVPAHPVCHFILSQLPFPLAMPSANISTRPSPTTAEHVFKTLQGRIKAILDGGSTLYGIESTVVVIDEEKPLIARLGAISPSDIELCLNESVMIHSIKGQAAPQCPGQLFLHYAPAVKETLLLDRQKAQSHWNDDCSIIACQNDYHWLKEKLGERPKEAFTEILPDEPHGFAQGIYAALYQAEKKASKTLCIICPNQNDQKWMGIWDRLTKASGKIREIE